MRFVITWRFFVRQRPQASGDDGVSFDFDEHVGGNQFADLDHAGGGPDGGEDLAVGAADLFPMGDVDDKQPGAHHIFQAASSLYERSFDVFDGLQSLDVHISNANDIAVGAGGGGSGHGYDVAHAYGA